MKHTLASSATFYKNAEFCPVSKSSYAWSTSQFQLMHIKHARSERSASLLVTLIFTERLIIQSVNF